jgi:molybdopterin converting factor small subunit
MAETGTVIVEFYGIPRQRAGRAELSVAAGTVGDALLSVEQACPQLGNLLSSPGRLSPHYLLSLGGQRFIQDLNESLRPGDRMILLSADAGG